MSRHEYLQPHEFLFFQTDIIPILKNKEISDPFEAILNSLNESSTTIDSLRLAKAIDSHVTPNQFSDSHTEYHPQIVDAPLWRKYALLLEKRQESTAIRTDPEIAASIGQEKNLYFKKFRIVLKNNPDLRFDDKGFITLLRETFTKTHGELQDMGMRVFYEDMSMLIGVRDFIVQALDLWKVQKTEAEIQQLLNSVLDTLFDDVQIQRERQ